MKTIHVITRTVLFIGMNAWASNARMDQTGFSADLFALVSSPGSHCADTRGTVEIRDWMPLPSVKIEKSTAFARITLDIPVRDRRFTWHDIPKYRATLVFCKEGESEHCPPQSRDITLEFMKGGERYVRTDRFDSTDPKTTGVDGTPKEHEVETQELLENLRRGIETLLRKNGDYAKKPDGAAQWNALSCGHEVLDRILGLR